jgi:arylsulfatase
MKESQQQKPNILWICTDQQRVDSIRALGNELINTPNIDRLVENGVTFNRAYCQTPICTPSRASFLTGRYPRTTGIRQNGNEFFPKDEVLVTKLFAEEGYDCGLAGKLHLSAAVGRIEERHDDGYSTFKWSHHPHDDWPEGHAYQDWLKSKGIEWDDHYKLGDWRNIFKPGEGGIAAEYHQTTWCTDEAIEFIKRDRNMPWLMSVNVFDPHPPYDPPLEYRERYDAAQMPLPKWKEGELENKPHQQKHDILVGGQDGTGPCYSKLSDAEKQQVYADYYAMVELIDDNVGRMMQALEDSGQLDNTIVLFMSDHGDMLGEHGLYWKGVYFYEEVIRVPVIFSWPGHFKKNLRSDALVELVDLAPTLLEAAGLEVPYYMQGKSFKGILTGESDPNKHKEHVTCEYFYTLVGTHNHAYASMYLNDRYKLVVHHGEELGELYDLQKDPDEFDNLWDHPDYGKLKLELIKKNFDASVLPTDPRPRNIAYS